MVRASSTATDLLLTKLRSATTLEQWSALQLMNMRSLTSCALYMRIMIPTFHVDGRRNLRESLLHLTTLLPVGLKSLRIMFYVPSCELAYPECALSPMQWKDLDEKLTRFSTLSDLHIGFEIRSMITQNVKSEDWDTDVANTMRTYLPRVYGKSRTTLEIAACIDTSHRSGVGPEIDDDGVPIQLFGSRMIRRNVSHSFVYSLYADKLTWMNNSRRAELYRGKDINLTEVKCKR